MAKYYTLTSLKNYLNRKYKTKENGTSFNTSDVQQYIRRGQLPNYILHEDKVITIIKSEDENVEGLNLYILK